jgi:hypothetical protein
MDGRYAVHKSVLGVQEIGEELKRDLEGHFPLGPWPLSTLVAFIADRLACANNDSMSSFISQTLFKRRIPNDNSTNKVCKKTINDTK